jgi:hypothetical protein
MFIVNFDSTYRLDDGYGNSGEKILLAMDKHPEISVHTSKNWSNLKLDGLNPRTIALVNDGFHKSAHYSIRYSQPDSFSSVPKCKRKRIGWSMWEFDKIPNAWKSGINSVEVRFVPCTHNQRLWIAAGAKTPTYVINLGVDPTIYAAKESMNEGKFTFLLSGTLNGRKSPGLVYTTFNKLFKDNKDAQLIIKSVSRLPIGLPQTENIKIINETWPEAKMAELMRQADCFVYPTQGEGFGLSPLEALSCGTTTICTNWSGPEDYLDESYSYALKHTISGSVGSHWGDRFGYAVPSVEHLEYLMLHTYNNREEVFNKGQLAAKVVREKFTWKHTAQRLYRVFKELG